jgi:hypothetical protein
VPFFRGMADQPHWLGVKACKRATFGDAGVALAAFWVTAFFAKTRSWLMQPSRWDTAIFIGAGVVATTIIEGLAVGVLERWTYSEAMPRVPVIGTGLLPLLQWLVIPPLVLWFVRRQSGKLPLRRSSPDSMDGIDKLIAPSSSDLVLDMNQGESGGPVAGS